MPLLDPTHPDDAPELQDVFDTKQQILGFVPNSALTMARWPALARAYGELSAVVANTRYIKRPIRTLVFLMASTAAGCRYCQAHSASTSASAGISAEKMREVWNFEDSSLFSEAERAAMRFAVAAGHSPSLVDDGHYDDLRRHFTDDEIVEMVGVIAFSGFMNRWNATMATELESAPRQAAEDLLGHQGWDVGRHE